MRSTFLLFFFLLFFTNISLAVNSGNYLAGRYALLNKDYNAAINFFEKSLDINKINNKNDNGNLEIAKELCTLYLLTNKINKCVSIGIKIEEHLDTDSSPIFLALIIDDIKNKNFNSALKRTNKIKRDFYERFSIPIIKAWILAIHKKNYKKSIEAINDLEKDFAIDGLRYTHIALINEYFEKYEEANIFYEKSINSYESPSFRLVQLAGNSFERAGKKEKAKKLYLKFSKDENDEFLISKEGKSIDVFSCFEKNFTLSLMNEIAIFSA